MNKVAELEIELKLKDEALKAKDAILKSKVGFQTRLLRSVSLQKVYLKTLFQDKTLCLMAAKLESRNLKSITDTFIQTAKVTLKGELCQTEEIEGVDFEVQVNVQSDKNKIFTKTVKQDNQEVALPSIPSSTKSKKSKKRKLSKSQSKLTDSIGNTCSTTTSNTPFTTFIGQAY